MESLWNKIQDLVLNDRYLIGLHASERLEQRKIMEWQVVIAIEAAIFVDENWESLPNPTVRVRELLPDGTEVLAVWAYLQRSQLAKLVTVYYVQ